MTRFADLSGLQKATEVVRWFGVLPAALLATVALNHLVGSSWPVHYVAECVIVLVGAVVAPRFRVGVAAGLATMIIFQSLANHVQFQGSLSLDFFFDSFKAICGAGLVYCIGQVWREDAPQRPRSDDLPRLCLALIATSAMLVLGVRHYRRADEARQYSDTYLKMLEGRRSSPESKCDNAVSMLATRINAYHDEHGVYPSDAQFGEYADTHGFHSLDPWNNALRYKRLTAHRFKVWSVGPDGVSGSDDDSTLTQLFGRDSDHDSFTRRAALQRVEQHKLKSTPAK